MAPTLRLQHSIALTRGVRIAPTQPSGLQRLGCRGRTRLGLYARAAVRSGATILEPVGFPCWDPSCCSTLNHDAKDDCGDTRAPKEKTTGETANLVSVLSEHRMGRRTGELD